MYDKKGNAAWLREKGEGEGTAVHFTRNTNLWEDALFKVTAKWRQLPSDYLSNVAQIEKKKKENF